MPFTPKKFLSFRRAKDFAFLMIDANAIQAVAPFVASEEGLAAVEACIIYTAGFSEIVVGNAANTARGIDEFVQAE